MDMSEQLKVQKKAELLVADIYKAVSRYPQCESRGLSQQMRNAAVSIGSNVAEGRFRASLKEYVRFVNIAYASGKELEAQVKMSGRIGYLSRDEEWALLWSIDEVLRMLWKLQTELLLLP